MLKYYYKGKGSSETGKREIATGLIISIFSPIIFAFALIYLVNSPTANRTIISPVIQIIRQYTSPINGFTKNDLISKGGQYSVFVENLKTGDAYYYNKDQEFESASLYKLWVMVVANQEILDGKLKETEVLSANKDDLDKELGLIADNISPTPTPSEKQTSKPVIISYTVSDAIDKMITVSDNYAALLLVHRLGAPNIASFLTANNYSESSFGSPPKTSAKDIASFYESLYKEQFINKEYSVKMLNLLKAQQINDRLPKYLPSQTVVAHKTGELDGYKHDAGIVFSKKGDYIIVVMSNTSNMDQAAGNIANFSKDVYNYETAR